MSPMSSQCWLLARLLVAFLSHNVQASGPGPLPHAYRLTPKGTSRNREGMFILDEKFLLPGKCKNEILTAGKSNSDMDTLEEQHKFTFETMTALLVCAKYLAAAGKQLQDSMQLAAWRNNRHRQAFETELPFWDYLSDKPVLHNLVQNAQYEGTKRILHDAEDIEDDVDELKYYGQVRATRRKKARFEETTAAEGPTKPIPKFEAPDWIEFFHQYLAHENLNTDDELQGLDLKARTDSHGYRPPTEPGYVSAEQIQQ